MNRIKRKIAETSFSEIKAENEAGIEPSKTKSVVNPEKETPQNEGLTMNIHENESASYVLGDETKTIKHNGEDYICKKVVNMKGPQGCAIWYDASDELAFVVNTTVDETGPKYIPYGGSVSEDEAVVADPNRDPVVRVNFMSDYALTDFLNNPFWSKFADFDSIDSDAIYVPASKADNVMRWATKNDYEGEVSVSEPMANPKADAFKSAGDSEKQLMQMGESSAADRIPDANDKRKYKALRSDAQATSKQASKSKGVKQAGLERKAQGLLDDAAAILAKHNLLETKQLSEGVISFKEAPEYAPGPVSSIKLRDPSCFSVNDPEIDFEGDANISTIGGAMNQIIEMAKLVKMQSKTNFVENVTNNMETIQKIKALCDGLINFQSDLDNSTAMKQQLITALMMGDKAFDNPLASELPYSLAPEQPPENTGMIEQVTRAGKLFTEMYETNKQLFEEMDSDQMSALTMAIKAIQSLQTSAKDAGPRGLEQSTLRRTYETIREALAVIVDLNKKKSKK